MGWTMKPAMNAEPVHPATWLVEDLSVPPMAWRFCSWASRAASMAGRMLGIEADVDFADSRLRRRSAMPEAFASALPGPNWNAAPNDRVLVGLFDLDDWQPWIPDAHALLDAAERRRVLGRRASAGRDQLALGYGLHRLLLGRVLGCNPADVPIGRDAAGCPRLSGSLLSTSLSHADGVVALAVTATGPVGVDIEPSSRSTVMPEIASRVLHPADSAQLAGLAATRCNDALLALWVRKEAFLKAAGTGLQREMQTFAAPDDALLALPGGGIVRIRMLDAGTRWVAAVAGAPDVPVECAWLRPDRAAAVEPH